MNATTSVHQIFYDPPSRAMVDPGFVPLDNSRNDRSDWREYWPMRQFLCQADLDAAGYVGFFSPKFHDKTGLAAADVLAFAAAQDADVVSFSPFIDQSAFFLNAFEQGEANHPGLIDATQRFLALAGCEVDVRTLVADHCTTVFSNFFVANGRFWRAWAALADRLFTLCESGDGELAQALNRPTGYRWGPAVQMKVFVMERLVCVLLAEGRFSSCAYDPFRLPRGGSLVAACDHEIIVAEGLKSAYRRLPNPEFLRAYGEHRRQTIASILESRGRH